MAENGDGGNANGDGSGENGKGGGDEYTAPATQADLDKLVTERVQKVVNERVQRERAKYSDYDTLKSKASQLDSLSAAHKSDEDKLNDRIAQLEADNKAATVSALRYRVATKFKVSDEDAELFLTGEDEDTLTRQAERLAEREAERAKKPPHVTGEGSNVRPGGNTDAEFARSLFGS